MATTVNSIYVNGVKKYLEHPEKIAPAIGIGGKWVKVRLSDVPAGPIVSEHSVPRELFDPDYRGRWRTGGNWYSQLPDSAFEQQPVAA